MNYELKWKENGVYARLFNEVNEQFIEYVNGLIIGHEKFENIKFQVWDFTQVKSYYINTNKGREIGALDKAASIWNKEIKVAVVTENKTLIKYTNQYIKEITDTAWECKIFKKLHEAEEWALTD